ncbi:MAG: hypothetical protein FJY37_01890 [Betaproteobacteria bacterium]|nr:hypothetical protein [Betaproteobacteria bacterium]
MKLFSPVLKDAPEGSEPHYRVMLMADFFAENYSVKVGQSLVRHYNRETLPDFLKVKLGMIATRYFRHPFMMTDKELRAISSEFAFRVFILDPADANFEHIGWRLSESYYIVILSKTQLESLEGCHPPDLHDC